MKTVIKIAGKNPEDTDGTVWTGDFPSGSVLPGTRFTIPGSVNVRYVFNQHCFYMQKDGAEQIFYVKPEMGFSDNAING